MTSAADFLPKRRTLPALREAAAECRGCSLYTHASQTVFGEGPEDARVMLVGEKPGDREDREGHPFVGPAGRLLSRAIAEAGLERQGTYITNAVKHFKWEARGKRRLHKKPLEPEIRACLPWLIAEIEAIGPDVVVAMGTTAARAMFGKPVRIRDLRGNIHRSERADRTWVTVHPSSVLRIPDPDERHARYREFVADLKLVAEHLH